MTETAKRSVRSRDTLSTRSFQALPTKLVRYALLVSEYPAVSHAFISREVAAMRSRGSEVATFTVRPSRAADASRHDLSDEIGSTVPLLGRGTGSYLASQLRLVGRHPRAWLGSLVSAARRGHGPTRAALWQVFYFVEAGVLVQEMRRAGVRHVHVHFANNGADVARTAVALARRCWPGEQWSWSLAMHGPTELEDVTAYDLAAKVRSAAFVASISDFCSSQLMRHVEPEHWPKLSVVRMGVDVDRFPARSAERAARGAGPLRVLFVGRLVPEKGPNLLLDAAQALIKAGVPVEVTIAGEGRLRADLQEQILRRGLGGCMHLVGAVTQRELPDLYAWADVFCLPSFAEGIPVVLMEAMATELPVISTRVAGIPELIEDGVSGRLVTPGRTDELVAALLEVAEGDRTVPRAWGVAGRAVVRDKFDPADHAQVLETLVRAAAS